MDLKRLITGLNFLILLLLIGCSEKHEKLSFNSSIVYKQELKGGCVPSNAKTHVLKGYSNADFQAFKEELYSLCDDSSEAEKFIKEKQRFAKLFYHGSILQNGFPSIRLISLVGHSGTEVGKTEGYLVVEGLDKTTFIKVYSVQTDHPELIKSLYEKGYILVTRMINASYDVRDDSLHNHNKIEYAIVKIGNTGEVQNITEKECEKILNETFAGKYETMYGSK